MKNKNKRESGAAVLLYMSLVSMICVLLLTLSYSRLMLAVKRNVALSDTIRTMYGAEFEMNDLLARLLGEYLESLDLISGSKRVGGTLIEVEGKEEGNKQTITVTASRAFAVNRVQAVRIIETEEEIMRGEIILAMDCTSSMDSRDNRRTTRMEEQKKAALALIDSLAEEAEQFDLRLAVFGLDAGWLRVGGDVGELRRAIEEGLGSTRDSSSACQAVRNMTSIGNGLALMNNYYRRNPVPAGTKRFEILISDGEPNSRSRYDENCLPSTECQGCFDETVRLLKCTLADEETLYDGVNYGDRGRDVEVYIITVLDRPASNEVLEAFELYPTEYYNLTNAAGLSEALLDVFESISESVSTTTITRIVPEPGE